MTEDIRKEVRCTTVPGDPFGFITPDGGAGLQTLVAFGNFFQFDPQARLYTSSQDVLSQSADVPIEMQTDQRAASVLTLHLLADTYRPIMTKSFWFLGIPFFPLRATDRNDLIINLQAAVDTYFGSMGDLPDFWFAKLKDPSRAYIPEVAAERIIR